MSNNNLQPIYIMPEDTKRSSGKDAQRNNIAAAKAVAQAVRTTLGPKGMDKMLVDESNNVIVTNDGVTILEEMKIDHPAAIMVAQVAKTQEDEIGDGTTTAVVLAGEFLKKAEDLLDQEIHPTVLANGYHLAESEAQRFLKSICENISLEDDSILHQIAITAMTGKGAQTRKEILASLIVRSVRKVSTYDGNLIKIDADDIKIETVLAANSESSRLIEGLVIDKERVHSAMPKMIQNARILILSCPLEIRNTEIDAKIQITDPNQLQQFLDQEERSLKEMVRKIHEVGASAVFCQRGIDDLAQHFLAKHNIFALRRVDKSDLEKLSRATGASIVANLNELSIADLGGCAVIEEKTIGREQMVFVEKCASPKVVTILIAGNTSHIVEEVKRAVTDAKGDVIAVVRSQKVVGGAGSCEIELAKHLRSYASTLSGRVQLAVQAYSDAIEIIPRTLAENAGLDPIDVITQLRSAHDAGQKWAGIDVFTGSTIDAWELGIVEPLNVKTLAIASATRVAEMILRIDDVILAGNNPKKSQKNFEHNL
jgi:archaeal chaperonin